MKFIHFGCWNKGFCNKDNPSSNGLSGTMKTIDSFLKSNEVSFISIAGDNYYPIKDETISKEKVKILNEKDLLSGFNCLPKDIDKYIIFGNHDIEDIIRRDDNTISCLALKIQQETLTDQYKLFNDVTTIVEDKTIVIMIDTTIYQHDRSIPISDTCYYNRNIFNNPKFITIGDIIDYQNNKLINLINSNPEINIIVIGHHPILSIKSTKIQELIKLTEIMPKIKRDFVYLCADVHNYQHVELDFNGIKISQYVVGTGGADLDKLNTDLPLKKEHSFNLLKFRIIEQRMEYGFCYVTVDDNINVQFIGITDELYKNKYLKYKTKYLKLRKGF